MSFIFKKHFLRFAFVIASVIGLVLSAQILSKQLNELTIPTNINLKISFLLAALLLVAIQILIMSLTWAYINKTLGLNSISTPRYIRAHVFGIPARYLPGKFATYLSRAYLLSNDTLPKNILVIGFTYEALLQVIVGTLFSGLVALAGFPASYLHIVGYLFVVTTIISLLLVWRHPIYVLLRLYSKLRGSVLDIDLPLLSRGSLTVASFMTAGSVFTSGLAFYCAINTLEPYPLGNIPIAIGVSSFAGTLGGIVVFVPSGLGVREGIIVALLSTLNLPLHISVLIAAVYRVVAVVADLAILLLTSIVIICHSRWISLGNSDLAGK